MNPYITKKIKLFLLKGIDFLIIKKGMVKINMNNKEYVETSYNENPKSKNNWPPGIIKPKIIAETIICQ